jgi:hypothetical protein
LLLNEIYGNYYNSFEEKLEQEIFYLVNRKAGIEEETLIEQFVCEIINPSKTPCIYVPGVQRAVELGWGEKRILDVWILLKLAMLNSVIENREFFNVLQSIENQKTDFIWSVAKFLTGVKSSYESWKMSMQAKLYHYNRENPHQVIELIISDSIVRRQDSINERVKGFIVRIRNAIVKSNSSLGMTQFMVRSNHVASSKNQVELFLEDLMQGCIDIRDRKEPAVETILLVENRIRQFHGLYGTRHSIYHFLEYLWIKTQELAFKTDLSSEEVLVRLEKAIKAYKNNEEEADRVIMHLPFVGKKWTVDPRLQPEAVDRLFADVEAQPGNSKQVWLKIEDCADLANWMLALRDMCLNVLNAGNKSIEETKTTLLKDLAKEKSRLGQLVALVKDNFEKICNHEEVAKNLMFDHLALHDITSTDGSVRGLLHNVMIIYNQKIESAVRSLKASRLQTIQLGSISKENLFKLTFDELREKLSQKFWGIDKKKKQLLDEVAMELREQLATLALVNDDINPRNFVYSDTRVDRLIKMAKEHKLWKDDKQEIPNFDMIAPLIKKLRQSTSKVILQYENSLFSLLKEDEQGKYDPRLEGDEIVFEGNSIKCPIKYLLYIHRLLLLKKLYSIYYQNKKKAVAKHDDVLYRVLGNVEHMEDNYCLLAAVAENKDENGILRLIIDSGKKGSESQEWNKELVKIESVQEAVVQLKSQTGLFDKFTLADLCAISFKIMDLEFKNLETN